MFGLPNMDMKKRYYYTPLWTTVLCINIVCLANQDAKRLYDDLLSNYNRLIRPVENNTDRLTVKLGLKLSQLIEVVSKIFSAYFYLFNCGFSVEILFCCFGIVSVQIVL